MKAFLKFYCAALACMLCGCSAIDDARIMHYLRTKERIEKQNRDPNALERAYFKRMGAPWDEMP